MANLHGGFAGPALHVEKNGAVIAHQPLSEGAVTFQAEGSVSVFRGPSFGQLEAKPYKTSWHRGGATRAPERLTVPTAAFTSAAGTVEVRADLSRFDRDQFLWDLESPRSLIYKTGTSLVVWLGGAVVYTTAEPSAGEHLFALRWEGTAWAFFIDGMKLASGTLAASLAAPLGVFALGDRFATLGNSQWNSSISEFRTSSRARTDTELADWQASLAVDADTTYRLGFDNRLDPNTLPTGSLWMDLSESPTIIKRSDGYYWQPAALTNTDIDFAFADFEDRKQLWPYPDTTLIDGGKIFTGTIVANSIAANTITAGQIAARTITANEIVAGTLTANEMAVGTITAISGIIADAAIGTAKIVDAAITNAKIADLAVSSAKITDLSVITAKIADLAVSNAKIANLAVDSAKIADLSVTTAKIASASITDAKIHSLSASKITAGTMSADRINGGDINGVTITGNTINGGTVKGATIYSSTSPSYFIELGPSIGSGYRIGWQYSSGYSYLAARADGLIVAPQTSTGALGDFYVYGTCSAQGQVLGYTLKSTSDATVGRNLIVTNNSYIDGLAYFRTVGSSGTYIAFTHDGSTMGHIYGLDSVRNLFFRSMRVAVKLMQTTDDSVQIRNYYDDAYRDITASGYRTGSSARYKENIDDFAGPSMPLVKGMRPRTFNMEHGVTPAGEEEIPPSLIHTRKRLGFIVEELPIEVRVGDDGYDLNAVVMLNTKAIQELNDRLATIERRA